MEIDNSTAVVTGAGRGIGAAIADRLARGGARVLVTDLDDATTQATADDINQRVPGSAFGLSADASSAAEIARIVATAEAHFGPVDLYVANAGIFGASGLGDGEASWSHAIDVNLLAHVRAAELLVPQWLERGHGYFVSTASTAGLLTQLGMAPYSVTKHAAVGFAEWLAITYGGRGIGVSCLCPMGVNTNILSGVDPGADPLRDLAVNAVTSAAAVLDAGDVADVLIQAIGEERFLVLPHPEVLTMFQHKAADPDHWVDGMRRYQARLTPEST